jgi:hypothetical protein
LTLKGARNDAVRAAAQLLWRGSVSGTAKELEKRIRQYLLDQWPVDRELGAAPVDCAALRLLFWRIVKLNNGDSLSWSWILRIIEQ